ncbi:MAG: substrate-binding domain-containing protein [Oscillospiraceae bacterium]|nr:substrate-binding domain-containing protein [Oscillospiraceae bacterium]
MAYAKDNAKTPITQYSRQKNSDVTRSRLAGFFRTCEKLGVSVPEEYVRPGRYHDPDTSAKATFELLALKKPPTCIIYPDDFSFIGGRNYLTAAGLSIPGDVSVAGYDGIYMSQVMRPALTTLQQDTDALGRRSAEMVIDAIENRSGSLPRRALIPGRLLPGATVKRLG